MESGKLTAEIRIFEIREDSNDADIPNERERESLLLLF